MANEPNADRGWWRRAGLWSVATAAVYATGVSGYLDLRQLEPAEPQILSWPEALYRGVRLFTLNVDLPDGTQAPWWLWAAAFLAPVLLARGVVALFRDRISRALVRSYARPRLVVFGANGRGAALVEAATADLRAGSGWERRWRNRWWRRDVVVVVDPDPNALANMNGPLVHTVVGDGTGLVTLRQAAVRAAADVVVTTDDAVRNSAIISALLSLTPPVRDLHVEVDDPGLAGALEQGGVRTGVAVSTFNAATLAAAGVLDDLAPAPAAELGSILLFGTGPLVDAFVLELYRRHRIRLLRDPDAPALRVAVFGPDAESRCAALARVLGSELRLVSLDPFPAALDQAVELNLDTARHLPRYQPIERVVVAVPTDLDGGGIALTLARHLGPGVPIALVTESGSNPFGREIVAQVGLRSDALSPIRLYSVPERAYSVAALHANRDVDRLARALREAQPTGPTAPLDVAGWNALGPAEHRRWMTEARDLLQSMKDKGAPLRRSALFPVDSPETPLLRALGVERPTALVRAGLRVDFTAPPALAAAARALPDPDLAFRVWCEVCRLRVDPALLAGDHSGDGTSDLDRLMLLRRAALGDPDARDAVLHDVHPVDTDRRIIVLLGDPTRPGDHVRALLDGAFDRTADPASVLCTGDIATARAFGPSVEPVPGGSRTARGRLLHLWATLLAAGVDPTGVRVLLLPGAGTDEIAVARVMGARIGWPRLPHATDLNRALLNGTTGLIPLPDDRMTVRAFLNPGRWPAELTADREALAREVHRRYLERQQSRKLPGDPALRPWATLSPWLQRSNLGIVDDIPNKLAAVGLRLHPGAPAPVSGGWPSSVDTAAREELAELEHGRYTAERLQSGWAEAVRDPAGFLSPYLVPWSDLDEHVKDYDRETITDLPAVLATRGIGLRGI